MFTLSAMLVKQKSRKSALTSDLEHETCDCTEPILEQSCEIGGAMYKNARHYILWTICLKAVVAFLHEYLSTNHHYGILCCYLLSIPQIQIPQYSATPLSLPARSGIRLAPVQKYRLPYKIFR